MENYIDSLLDIKPTLHSWDKPHLVIKVINNHLLKYILCTWFANILLKPLSSMFMQNSDLWFYFLIMFSFDNKIILAL